MFRKLFGKGKDAGKSVTEATPDDWNRADQAGAQIDADAEASISFANLGKTFAVKPGTSILDAAVANDIDLNNYCGGMCSCGSCRIVLVSGKVSEMDDMEEATLSVVQEDDEDRLGCQTKILGHVVVNIPDQDF